MEHRGRSPAHPRPQCRDGRLRPGRRFPRPPRGDHLLRERPRHGADPETPAPRQTGAGARLRAHRAQIRRLLRRGREQHPFRGRVALRPVLLHPYRPRAAAGHAGAAQLFFHEVRRYGARGRPGGLHHLAGGVERRAGTSRARVADEPLPARIGRAAAQQPLRRPRGNGSRQRPGYPAKESRHGGTLRAAAGLHRIPQAVERDYGKQPFPVVRPGDPHRGQSGQRPLRQTGDGVYPRGGRGRHRPGAAAYALGGLRPTFRRELLPGTYARTEARNAQPGTAPPGGTAAGRAARTAPCRGDHRGDTGRRPQPSRAARRGGETPRRRRNGGAGLPPRYRNRGAYPHRGESRTGIVGTGRRTHGGADRGGAGRLRGLVERAGEPLVGAAPAAARGFRTNRHSRAGRGRSGGGKTAGRVRRVAFRHGGNSGSRARRPIRRAGKRAAGAAADALRSVRLYRRGAAAGRTRRVREKEPTPGSKTESSAPAVALPADRPAREPAGGDPENDAPGA